MGLLVTSAAYSAIGALFFGCSEATMQRMHLRVSPSGYEQCLEGYVGKTVEERCNALVSEVKNTYSTFVNSTSSKEMTCDEINAKLEELERKKKRCSEPLNSGYAGDGVHGAEEVCTQDLKQVLPMYIDYYKELKKKQNC
eukprot:gnl/MRDRNA2_/MRDRNA2_138544_c0_seq1.p1 gnl/MRDRNA2_/MRDRNA2_138544_c0~~gnl/MRDRNA2_/MRDRNA2_138544_c0_seq1.p1  ORF type:complete len:140 (+),score=36.34 gnl/MRDRNA2_/MRDRNA2_138544_c0_seq1:74-493(+)